MRSPITGLTGRMFGGSMVWLCRIHHQRFPTRRHDGFLKIGPGTLDIFQLAKLCQGGSKSVPGSHAHSRVAAMTHDSDARTNLNHISIHGIGRHIMSQSKPLTGFHMTLLTRLQHPPLLKDGRKTWPDQPVP